MTGQNRTPPAVTTATDPGPRLTAGGVGQPFSADEDAIAGLLALAARLLDLPTVFVARPSSAGWWHVTSAINAEHGCNVEIGSYLRLPPLAHSPTSDPSIPPAPRIGACLVVPLYVTDDIFYGRLCAADPLPREFTTDAGERLTTIGRLLVTIIDRERETATMRDSVERFRTIVDATAEGIILRLADGRIAAVNSSAEELIGLPADKLLGQVSLPFPFVVLNDDGAPTVENTSPGLVSLRSGQPLSHVEIGIRRPDGEQIWVTTNSRPLVHAGETAPYAVVTSFADISERKRAAAALRNSEARYRSLSASSLVGIFEADQNGFPLYANQRCQHILGRTSDELRGEQWGQHVHTADREAVAANWRAAVRAGAEFGMEFRVVRPDGEARWVAMRATPLANADGENTGYVGTVEDIEDRTRAEAELRQSEERFRHAFENALAGMALTDHEGRFTWVNLALCRMLGYRESELLASSFHSLLHADDLEAARADSSRLFTGKMHSYQRERRFVHKRGHVVWGLLSASILRDAGGKPVQVIGQVQDITERKRMEAALRESDDRFRALISSSSDIITVLDARGAIRSISPAVERVLGYTPEELLGHQNLNLVHPDDLARLRWTFIRGIRSPGVKRRVEVRFRHRDGSWRCLEVITHALLTDPAISGIVADARDITERKAAAEALEEANAQLKHLNQAKSDFVSLVSHEFRTPLTGIRGFSELIRDEDLSLAEIKEFAGDINADAQRLGRLIDQLLDLERMQSGRMQLHRVPVDANQIMREVAQQFRAASARHHLCLDLADSLPLLSGDRDKLIQVVTNLVGNAIKYSPDGGEVVLSSNRDGRSIRIAVRDQGIGIPATEFTRVFDRYARVEGGAGRFIKGIGLGLPIARQIVDLHGGQIWVQSTVGQGATFHVLLPITDPSEE